MYLFRCIILNADNKRLKQIEDSASNSYLKTRSKFSEWIFTNRILNNLEDKGVGTIVVRNAATFTEMAKDIRKELIEKNLIKAVIQLPSNLITNTAIPTTLLILQKTIAIRLHLLMLQKFILKRAECRILLKMKILQLL